MTFKNRFEGPIRLKPNNFTYNMWGGQWIAPFKNLPSPGRPIGESWEFSTHRDRPNFVLTENDQEMSLLGLVAENAERVLGKKWSHADRAPFLIKFIDSRDDLSVQVHPSDEKARALANDCGKSEAWYVLDVGTGPHEGFIYLGFNPEKAAGYSRLADFEEAFLSAILQANSQGPIVDAAQREKASRLVLPFLNRIKVEPGQAYRVNPGTIHAIGRGVRLFEIQETSDITYRLWDWNRPDADMLAVNKLEFRPLHLEQAKKVLDYHPRTPAEYRMARREVPLEGEGPVREELLIEEEERRFAANMISLKARGASVRVRSNGTFSVLTCVAGAVRIERFGVLERGHTVLLPACVAEVQLTAHNDGTEIIKSYVP